LRHKSAEKAARVSIKRQKINKSVRSQVKTDVTNAEKLLFAGDIEGAKKAVAVAVSDLDKAAEKQILHGNNAARRKARLLKKLNQAQKKPAEAKKEKAA
jgi:small subunit ribosomal protein S20